MKDAQKALEDLVKAVAEGKPLVADLLIQEGGTGKQYTVSYDPTPKAKEAK
jgi:hypothetical protein